MVNYKDIVKSFFDEAKKSFQNLKSIKTIYKEIPNFLTFSRLGLVPFIIINILSGNLVGAGILTGIASLTDCFDGLLARKLKATSEFGRQLDAIIDKIFIVAVALPLSIVLPHLLLPITLDMTIAGINGYSHLKGYNPKTSKWGKRKTIFLDSLIATSFFTIIPALLPLQIGLYISTIGLQIKTGIDYYKVLHEQQKEDIQQTISVPLQDEITNEDNEKQLEKKFDKNLNDIEILKECKQYLCNKANKKEEENKLILRKK